MSLLLLLAMGCDPEQVVEIEGDEAGECDDGADNDQDGDFDCDDDGCDGSPVCVGVEDTGDPPDEDDDKDNDGFTVGEGDCDDTDADVNPGAVEVCNGRDDDCNGEKDDDPIDGETFYQDQDGDGYGDASNTIEACDKPSQYSTNADDCDDSAKDANPNGVETDWDGIDQDCDGYDVNLDACVVQSVADATAWVSWSYYVTDKSEDWFVAGYELYNQVLHVDADSYDVETDHSDLAYTVTVDSLQALNTSSDPFDLDAFLGDDWYLCYGYVDWVQVPYNGGIEVLVSGTNVTGQVNMTATWDGIVQDDLTAWDIYGNSCPIQTIDTILAYGGYSILDPLDTAFTSYADEIGDEFENEIVYYIEQNCSK